LRFWTDPIILEFVYGMGLGLIYAEGVRLGPVPRAVLSIAALAMLVAVVTRHGELATALRALAYGIPAAMLVAALAFGGGDGAGRRLARAGAAVGDASYALYLIHPFVIRAGREIVWRAGLAGLIGPWTFVLLSLSGAVLASVAVYRLFERPATAWLRARLRA
jgi:peptidoglycan/LPS O-acetylase OafA/YrhL